MEALSQGKPEVAARIESAICGRTEEVAEA
jgi:hypothetical protein